MKLNCFGHMVACALMAAALVLGGCSQESSTEKGKGSKTEVQEENAPGLQRRTTVEHGPNGEVRQVTTITMGNASAEDIDSLMNAHIAEMREADKRMNEMMKEMMEADPLAGMMMDDSRPTRSARNQHTQQPARIKSTTSKTQLAGMMGNEQLAMVLNLKDPQNVVGSGRWAGKALHVLGIQDGYSLTVSLYSGKQLVGTLSGEFDGRIYRGSAMQGHKEVGFELSVQ